MCKKDVQLESLGWKAVLWKWNNCLVFRLYKGNETWGRRIWRWITNDMRVLMKVTPENSTTEPVTCKVLASVMLFLLWMVLFALHIPPRSTHTSPVFAGEAEEPQAWYDLRPLTCSAHLHLWYTTWAQASLNVTSTQILWRDRFHVIPGLMNHVLLLLLLPPTLN